MRTRKPPTSTIDNIDTVARLEQEFLENRTLAERIGDSIGSFVGTMPFVLLHVIWFLVWGLINVRLIPGIPAFDPYPFMLLSMIVSLEGVLLTTFVLMKQNRMSRRADHRNQLNLQVDLLAEKEATRIIQMLQAVCKHMGLEAQVTDPELRELSQNTAVDALAEELRRKIPD